MFHLSQHIGAPAKAIVNKGDQVLVGQVIGEANGFVSANVISSVSGVVKTIEPRMSVSGLKSDAIVISNDHEYKAIDGFNEPCDYTTLSREEIIDKIKKAGVVGLGGAGFPTHVKVNPKDSDSIEYIIINGAECEPYLTSDYRLMLEEPKKIIEGLKIVLSLFNNAKVIIGIEDNKPEAIKILSDLCVNEANIKICSLKTKYPQGGERSLIYALTNKKIYSRMLPSDVGCIVDNIATICAIYDAVALNKPLIDKVITITGDCVNHPCNIISRFGSSYQYLVDQVNGFKSYPEKIISGGPMMGTALFTLDIPLSKTSSALLALTHDEVASITPTACIHCGRCVEVCPSRIIPQKAYKAAVKGDRVAFEAADGMECCECGCCTYVCPAKRNMTQSFKKLKRQVMASRKGQ